MLQHVDLPNVVILSGSSGSTKVPISDDAFGVSIQAPATVTASQIQVWAAASSGTSAAFAQMISGGTIVVLGQAQYLTIAPIIARQLMLQSTAGGGEGQTDTFLLTKIVQI